MSDARQDLESRKTMSVTNAAINTATNAAMNEPTNLMAHVAGRAPMPPARHSAGAPAYGEEWPPVWFSLVQHAWTSIVLVPARPGMSTLGVARALAAAGRLYEERTVCCLEAEHVPPTAVRKVIADLRDRSATGERTVVSVSSPLDDHGAVPIARAADAAVLVVPLGEAGLAEAKKTIAAIGAGSFIGAITVSGR
jgi:hypothetical protein